MNATKIINALISALKRGVNVNLLLNLGYQGSLTSIPGVGGSNVDNAMKIVKAIKKYELVNGKAGNFNLRWYVDPKGRLSGKNPKVKGHYSSHTKYYSFDNQITMIGSSNLDRQSFYWSKETNVLIDHHRTTTKWCKSVFRSDFLRGLDYRNYKKN